MCYVNPAAQEYEMSETLFADLKQIGIKEELAARVSSALDPDHIATKKDVLIMQEALLQHQKQMMDEYRHLEQKSDERYYELKTEMVKGFAGVRTEFAEVRTEMADIRSEMGSMHRQYWITFGGLITTLISVFAVNWYFHTF